MILSQTPAPSGAPDPDLVTPGTIGFLVTLFIVVIVIFLIRDALRRVRRVRARSAASDAYPIPLRKHAVPNQSKLSGAQAPESKDGKGAGRAESSTAEDKRASSERPSGAGPAGATGHDTGDQSERPPR